MARRRHHEAGRDVSGEYRAAFNMDPARDLSNLSAVALAWAERSYRADNPKASLLEFQHGDATYLFDAANSEAVDRTVFVVGRPTRPSGLRDVNYQRNYPLPDRTGQRPMDRGHFMPFSGGGLFGPNLFAQDRALNRGWSAEGRAYRRLESRAVEGDQSLFLVRPLYADDSDVPAFIDLVIVGLGGRDLVRDARRFRNRYDIARLPEEDQLRVVLDGATDSQLGALGEEAAKDVLTVEFDAAVVTMGDAGMPRNAGRQDLDLVVIIEGALVAVEVKTRYNGASAGRLTQRGSLAAPRMSRSRVPGGNHQGSQGYVAARLQDLVDIDDEDYAGVDVVVVVFDLRGMWAQLFELSDTGRRTKPCGTPLDCRRHVNVALRRIIEHRGYL